MISIQSILLFILVFSILIVLRTSIRFVMSIVSIVPVRLVLSKLELITNGIALSYIKNIPGTKSAVTGFEEITGYKVPNESVKNIFEQEITELTTILYQNIIYLK